MTAEPIYDRRDQLQQIQSGLLDGENLFLVYDAIGIGTGFMAITDRRVIMQDKSFTGKKFALVSIPYSRIESVSVISDKSWTSSYFSTSSIAVATARETHEVEFRGEGKAKHAHNLILWHMLR